jgi:ATP-dependent protease HslVU (ClpYQ) peptidase subunit
MTLVVAEETPDGIQAGADTAVTFENMDEIYEFNEPKIFTRGGFLLGFCGSARVGQVLAHHVELPEVPKTGDLTAFLVHELVPTVRNAMETHGPAYESLILGPKTNVLVGCRGELFCLTADLVVLRTPSYVAIGSGRKHAYATMYALKKTGYGTARERVEIALETAAEFTPSVRGPWTFCTLPK